MHTNTVGTIVGCIVIACLIGLIIFICADCFLDEWKDDKKNDTIDFEEFKLIVHTVNSLNNAILMRYGSNYNPVELSIFTDLDAFRIKIFMCHIVVPPQLHIPIDLQDRIGTIYKIEKKYQRRCYRYYKKHINSYKVQNTKLYDELLALQDKTINYIDKM